MNARTYDPITARFMQIDPMLEYASPYAYVGNNPLNLVDPTGMFSQSDGYNTWFSESATYHDLIFTPNYFAGITSTHTDEQGNVVAVYDDGDLGVYSHSGSAADIKEKTDKCNASGNTSCGGTKQGETYYWDEFISPESGDVFGRIYFGTTWDEVITGMNELAIGLGGEKTAAFSRSGYLFDIKNGKELSPSGAGTGRLLNGKYVTARSAGNYLAGLNGATTHANLLGFIPVKLNLTEFLKVAGAVHTGNYEGRSTVRSVKLYGTSFGPYPYYGEIPYAGRMIVRGWNSKN